MSTTSPATAYPGSQLIAPPSLAVFPIKVGNHQFEGRVNTFLTNRVDLKVFGTLGPARTDDLEIRNFLLYPTELRGQRTTLTLKYFRNLLE